MTDLIIPDGQPYFEFAHEGTSYAIWVWLADDPEVYRIGLGEVKATPGGHNAPYIPGVISSATKTVVDNAGGVKQFMIDNFLPKVNFYLSAQGGGTVPDIFPEDANHKTQFNWIVESGLEYVNGQVLLTF